MAEKAAWPPCGEACGVEPSRIARARSRRGCAPRAPDSADLRAEVRTGVRAEGKFTIGTGIVKRDKAHCKKNGAVSSNLGSMNWSMHGGHLR